MEAEEKKVMERFVPRLCSQDASKHLLEYKWNGQYFRCTRKRCDYTGWIINGTKYPMNVPCNISAFFDLSAKAVGGKGHSKDGAQEAYYGRAGTKEDQDYIARVAQATTPEYQAKILAEVESIHFKQKMKAVMDE